jgi:hypothetical protein
MAVMGGRGGGVRRCAYCGVRTSGRFCSRACEDARDRAVLVLRLRGASFREVGEAFGIGSSGARNAFSRARRELMGRMRRAMPDDTEFTPVEFAYGHFRPDL